MGNVIIGDMICIGFLPPVDSPGCWGYPCNQKLQRGGSAVYILVRSTGDSDIGPNLGTSVERHQGGGWFAHAGNPRQLQHASAFQVEVFKIQP